MANVLEILKITENRYLGIPTIQKELKNTGLPAPIFSIIYGEFKVTFKNNIYQENSVEKTNGIEKDILKFCEIPRTRSELLAFTGMSRYHTMSKIVQPLLESGKLKLTIPDKPKSSKQKYQKA